MKTIRISITVVLAALALACLYAVLFMHRPEHLLTFAVYGLMAYMPWCSNKG